MTGAVGAPKASGVERVSYFAGQLLGTSDFVDEQNYFRTRLRRRNLYLHGAGVVSGLRVTLARATSAGGQNVVVDPGFALDPRGEEIEVCQDTAVPLPLQGQILFVQLLYVERPTAPVPSPGPAGNTPGEEQAFSRVEETFTVVLTAVARADAVSIARLTFRRGRWQVDHGFQPQRA